MNQAEMENELQDLRAQLRELREEHAELREEHAKTESGWLSGMRNIGFGLMSCSIASLTVIVLQWQMKNPSGPAVIFMALVMLFFGIWLVSCSRRPTAERIMRLAPRW
jgi:hypothetical protein